jgi:hypothetical protein
MNETIEKIKGYVMANPLIALLGGLAIAYAVKPSLFRSARRRRRRARLTVAYRRRSHKKAVRRTYTRRSSKRPAWMVKGSPAARRHMAQLRRRRAS